MTPRAQRELAPFFQEIEWRNFQRLCNELFSHEPGIATSDEYGPPGQHQHGIDLLALIRPSGIAVAQCKRETSFSVKKIQTASDEFFAHWGHWKEKDVRQFVLFVACEVNRTEFQDEKLKQRERFAKHGITYELWGATTLAIKLRPYRTIARTYFDSDDIVTAICGPAIESAATTAGVAFMTNRVGILTTEVEALKGKELESLREFSRAGEQSRALAGIAEIKDAPTWLDHTSALRARVLRLEAAFRLNRDRDTELAAQLIREARQLDPSGDFQTIDGYLTYCRRDASVALSFVSEPKSIEAQNLRWSLLLETHALDVLSRESSAPAYPPDAEGLRILALLALARADVPSAQVAVARAVEFAPSRRSIRLAKAVVNYFSALSPAAEGLGRLAWAVPVSWIFVKRDATSVAALGAAETEFYAAAQHPDCLPPERENLQVWRLACIACVDQRQADAAALVQEILTANPASYGAIVWALHRGFFFDRAAAEVALRKRLVSSRNPTR